MVIMDSYYSSNRLQELWQTVDHLHLSYLEVEESPEKLDYRIKLESCIKEFLCMASHSQKFTLHETADVLYRSAAIKKDFSGYKAATGWNAIQMYAGNLLSQPWRREYRQIKTYCGFYKHQIEANLVGAEVMFRMMGYKCYGNGILILEGPICPDRVTSVSKDCLLAYVECQILKAIWEGLSPAFKISWLEVLQFRKTHFCSPEQSIRALNYQFYEKQYQAQNSDIYSRCHETNPMPGLQCSQVTGHSHIGPPLPYICGTNTCCANNYATYTHLPYGVPVQYPQHLIKPNYANGYYCGNGFLGQEHAAYGYTVPTGQLIELDSLQNGELNTVDYPPTNVRVISNTLNNRESKKSNDLRMININKEESHFDDWDYVYRNLESQGYSKDLGERGDILTNKKNSKPTNLDYALYNLAVTDRPLKIAEPLDKYEKESDIVATNLAQKHSEDSSYEDLSEDKKSVSKIEKRKVLLSQERNVSNNISKESTSKILDNLKVQIDKWECKACTFHNENIKDICEMCSKSRINVEQQMEVGGPQCSKCTLVNSKDSKVCQACGASLKNSPTYI